MSRRVNHVNVGVAHLHHLFVLERYERYGCPRRLVEAIRSPCAPSKVGAPRQVVGMDVRVDHLGDRATYLLSKLYVGIDILVGIDDRQLSSTETADRVRKAAGLAMLKAG